MESEALSRFRIRVENWIMVWSNTRAKEHRQLDSSNLLLKWNLRFDEVNHPIILVFLHFFFYFVKNGWIFFAWQPLPKGSQWTLRKRQNWFAILSYSNCGTILTGPQGVKNGWQINWHCQVQFELWSLARKTIGLERMTLKWPLYARIRCRRLAEFTVRVTNTVLMDTTNRI